MALFYGRYGLAVDNLLDAEMVLPDAACDDRSRRGAQAVLGNKGGGGSIPD
jgi:FAD/FMN-containing dehydrogenase